MTDSKKGEGYLAVLGNWRNIDSPSETERLGTVLDGRSASKFNDFIHSSGLCDLPMSGKRFIRMNNLGLKHMAFLDLRNKINSLDNKAESSFLSPSDVDERNCLVKLLFNLEQCKVKDLRQKAMIQWVVEGDDNSHFFHGRQIIDNPLMVDKIIAWAKKYKKRIKFLKVEFEKAFDSLSWSFLFSILEQIGFSSKWRTWIHSCLNSAFALVLVNGSPTIEFKIERGLRQGDPLSPFLFILAVKALSVALLEAINNNIFHEWSRSNAKNFSRILTCFHLASGLKVNFNKSKLYGICTSNAELCSLASTIGCLASQFPCTYLGLPIGAKMSRFHTEKQAMWCKVIRSLGGLKEYSSLRPNSKPWYHIAKLKDDLLKVNINLPSLFKKKLGNGRNTSFCNEIWVGDSPLIASFPHLFHLETNSNCLVCNRKPIARASFSVFSTAIRPLSPLSPPGLNFTWAWQREPKPGLEFEELISMVSLISNLFLSNAEDCWEFTSDASRKFTVKGMRSLISSSSKTASLPATHWNKVLPLKININTWCVLNRRMATRVNIDRRGIDLNSLRCPICDDGIKTKEHVFVHKRVAFLVVEKYVRNAWKKYGISRERLLLLLQKWTLNASLLNKDMILVPVWVILHNIPIIAFIEDGLSAMVTKIGTLVILDLYTSSWGRLDYACALIDIRAYGELKEEMIIVILNVRMMESTYNVDLKKLDDPFNKVDKSGSGVGNKSLYERWTKTYDENLYDDDDDFEDCGLTETQMALANSFDINFRGQLR
ncbi:putative RNA-directed DNA polymerase, eukaryota, reverse transcriptase zinc-binding domain protein [Tanacetum coccineum]